MPESCQNSVRSGTEDYSLYVTNLPFELNEDGIQKIFKEYGSVKAIRLNNAGEFAFVSYGTYAEAEDAIRSLDGKAPLDLKVQFRRKRVDKSIKHLPDPSSDSAFQQSSLPPQQEQILPKSITYSRNDTPPDSRIESLGNKFPSPQYHHIGPTMQYPMISPHLMHYPHDNMEYAATNALWSRGSMTMDAAGRRHITMGRGYTSYSIPEPRPRIISDIGKIFEERNPGIYKYRSDECKEYFGECMKCSRHAALCCSICEGFYCSRACQIADWSKHEGKCGKIPPLVDANAHQHQCTMERDIELIVEESRTEVSVPRSQDQEEVEVKQQPTLRRPKSVNDNKKDDSKIDNVKITDNMPQPAAPAPPAQHEENNFAGDTCQPQSVEKAIINSVTDNFLSSSCFVDVQITSVKEAGRLFFVQKIEDAESIAQLMLKLNENIQQFMLVDKPVIGEIYGVVYDGLWYRGLVLSLDPAIIDYIDWGTVEELSVDMEHFRAIGNLAELPRFSQLIKFSDKLIDKSKNFEIDCILSVKKINVEIENDVQVITVDVLEESISVETGVIASTSEEKVKKPPCEKKEKEKDIGAEKQKGTGDDERKETGNIEKNSSLTTRKIIGCMQLKDNSKVLIQSYRNPSTIFLRSLEPEEIERYNRLIQNVARSALTSPPLESLPQSADYILAQFVDDNYYRASVISAEPDTQKIKVIYIDYGDIQVTTLDKLKMMPESLMDEPCCLKMVRLYNIKSTPPTGEAFTYIANAVASEEQFIYQFRSSINGEDHVVLESVTAAGSCLNDKINYMLTPTWERSGYMKVQSSSSPSTIVPLVKENESSLKEQNLVSTFDSNPKMPDIFFLDDMKSGKFDGNIGDTVSVLFLDTIVPGYKYVFAPEDAEMIVHLTRVMPESMKKYSESTSHYIPRANELCIALLEDGNWYRGCCLNANASSTSAFIFFLDFGNFATVPHTNIRRMIEDFLEPKAFGCICNVLGFTDSSTSEISSQVLARLETLILRNETYKVEIVAFDGEEYEIKLPEIRAKLIEEGLLLP